MKQEVLLNHNVKIELIVDDALNVLHELPPNQFHLAMLDPLYLVTEAPNVHEEHLDVLKTEINWNTLFRRVYRVLKDEAMLVIFGHLSTFAKLWNVIESAGFEYVTDIVWVKSEPVNFLQAKKKPLSQHETITVWKKGKLRYNWEDAMSHGHEPYYARRVGVCSFYNIRQVHGVNNGSRYMTDILFAPHKPNMPVSERTEHPTQKPLALVERLVRAFSFKGENVIDPFAGSGTTLVACAKTGRNCLGIEINEKYAEIIRKRIKSSVQLSLEVFESSISSSKQV
jgi:site-specific DNA-methyltransferase (adenine-specific)